MVVRLYDWDKVRKEYKTYTIGEHVPIYNCLSRAFSWDSTPQGYMFWFDLRRRFLVFTEQHYNALADIYGDPHINDNANIEDCM